MLYYIDQKSFVKEKTLGRGRKNKNPLLNGLLVVDKPLGWTSANVVSKARRATGFAKVGHTGTLDPLATGVLVLCVGKATKLAQQIVDDVKTYQTEIDLSAFTQTDDLEGDREEIFVEKPPSLARISEVLAGFVGIIEQQPSMFSAIKINGKRAYDLARQGCQVVMPTRRVRIDQIVLIDYAWPVLNIRVVCGKGTYIRSLGRDIGKALGTGGHLVSLRRERVGMFGLADAVGVDRLDEGIGGGDLLPLSEPWPRGAAEKE